MVYKNINKSYDVIGLMSGTSLDGLDMAHCIFHLKDDNWSYKIKETRHVPYTNDWVRRLKEGILLSDEDLTQLNEDYGHWLGEHVGRFILDHKLSPDIVASHGHTIKHQPKDGITVQIGSGQVISDTCRITAVSDFRSLDVSLGGQGAPLVPIGDRDLFGDFDFCLNLGGIANISFEMNGERIAYDIGIANMALNYLANQLGKEYDNSGDIASGGKPDLSLQERLNGLNYYQLPYPKSTGYEWFRDEVIPLFNESKISIEDKLNTTCHHIVDMIASDILHSLSKKRPRLLITGGGAKNTFLMNLLTSQLSEIEVIIPNQKIIDYKESAVFAFLGVKRIRKEINCLRSVTGATRDSCGGVVFDPS